MDLNVLVRDCGVETMYHHAMHVKRLTSKSRLFSPSTISC
jgi:hypothetical protein